MGGDFVVKKRGMGFYVRKVMPFIIFQIAADFVCTLLASMYPYLQKLLFDSDQKLTVIFWYAVFHVLDVLINYVGMRATFAQGIGIERAMKHDFFKGRRRMFLMKRFVLIMSVSILTGFRWSIFLILLRRGRSMR